MKATLQATSEGVSIPLEERPDGTWLVHYAGRADPCNTREEAIQLAHFYLGYESGLREGVKAGVTAGWKAREGVIQQLMRLGGVAVQPASIVVQPAAAPVTVENHVQPTPVQVQNTVQVPAPRDRTVRIVRDGQGHMAGAEIRTEEAPR